MTGLLEILGGQFWSHLLLALAHTLWIGALAALGLCAALKALPARRAELRHGAAALALMTIVIGGVVALAWLEYAPGAGPVPRPARQQTAAAAVPARPAMTTPHEPGKPAPIAPTTATHDPLAAVPHLRVRPDQGPWDAWTAWLAGAWLIGAALMLTRTARSLAAAGRVRRSGRPLADPAVQHLFDEARAALGVARRVAVLVSEDYVSPFVIGAVWPAVLLPASLMSGLPPEQVRAILAHELAHIRRHDTLVNLGQMFIESLLFFNPFVWWIGRQLRSEREACCDALAAKATGRRLDYARALVDFAGCRVVAPQAAPAFGDARRPSGLLERIRRLAQPGYRPALRLPWYSLVLFLAVAALSLACIKKASDAAVKITAQALSPAQRVETMKAIEKQFGPGSGSDYGEKDKVTISGRIVTADGSPPPKNFYIEIHSVRPRYSYGTSTSVNAKGEFKYEKLEYGTIQLSCRADGFALAALAPLTPEPGARIDNIVITLRRGFAGKVQLTDPQGHPVPGFRFDGHYTINSNSWNSRWGTGKGPLTDAQGLATINDCSTYSLTLEGAAPGWQESVWKDVKFDPGRTVPLQIKPAAPTEGVIVGAKDGFPVPGAKIRILHRALPEGISLGWSGDTSPVAATSDDDGKFKLDFLRDDTPYILLIDPPGFRREIVRDVKAGRKDLKIEAKPRLIVRGRVLGAQFALKYNDKPYISYYQSYQPQPYSTMGGSRTQLELVVKDDVGTFEFSDLYAGELRIEAGSQSKELTVKESLKDVEIDLRPPSAIASDKASSATREVIFKFALPAGAPSPTGMLQISHLVIGETNRYTGELAPIENGVARIRVTAPTKIGYNHNQTVGYWFKDEYGIDVPAGATPFEVTIPVTPSGAIFGQTFNKDGKPLGECFVSIVEVAKAPSRGNDSFNVEGKTSFSAGDTNNKFNLSPLPLGGKYAVIAYHDATFVLSKAIKLTEKEPLCQVDLTLPEGKPVTGRVVDESGKPLAGMTVNLSYATPYDNSYSHGARTGADGTFTFEHVNADAPGKYDVSASGMGFQAGLKESIRVGGRPVEIKLKKGLTLTGRAIDDETGKPLSGVEIFAWPQPRPFESYSKEMSIRSSDADEKTDTKGEFHFSRLGPYSYNINCRQGQVVPQTLQAEGGQGAMVLLRVKLYEWEKKKR